MRGHAASAKSAKDALRRLASSTVSGRFVRRSRSCNKRSNTCFSDIVSDPAIEVLVAHAGRVILHTLDVAAVLGPALKKKTDGPRRAIVDGVVELRLSQVLHALDCARRSLRTSLCLHDVLRDAAS